MKTRIIGFFLVLSAIVYSTACNAQNGGQMNENPSVKMEFVSVNNGVTTLKITNKQDCIAEIQTKAPSTTRVKSYAPHASDTIKLVGLTGVNVKVQSKALTVCGVQDYGQVEITLNINDLPVRIIDIRVKMDYEIYRKIVN